MPVVKEQVPITAVLGKPREGMSRHVFLGGNFFMQRMLNKFRDDLSVDALPQELEGAADRTVEHLQSRTARLTVDKIERTGDRLDTEITVENLGGHKLPTAYPSRRAWLHVLVRDASHRTVFESGALNPNGSIQGNDNDADPHRYEPHYTRVTSGEQVQIYEDIMVDPAGVPTTGLLTAVRFAKDHRLLPRGFDKQTADKDIAVMGSAADDQDFTGGQDRIHYSVALANIDGRLQIEAELYFQPISYRWASNLRPYRAEEPRRFVGYYDTMSSASAVILARATATSE